MISINDILQIDCRPAPYEPGEELWNDPHISTQMLVAHLAPDTDAASYRTQKIRDICDYLPGKMRLPGGAAIVDLGCGPGLYASALTGRGCRVTGIDRSESSLRYGREHDPGHRVDYRQASYLAPFGEEEFDAAILVSEDYGVLGPEDRHTLLALIFKALRPGGCLALDVSSLAAYEARKERPVCRWHAAGPGFWRPHRHFVLEKAYFYDQIMALCDLTAILDTELKIYRIWQTFFSADSIGAELERGGFRVEAMLSSLWGEAYRDDSPTIAVICRK